MDSFVRKYAELPDVRRVYDLFFIEVVNPTATRLIAPDAKDDIMKHRMAFYVEYAGRQLYIGLPDRHIMAPGGWPRELKACSPRLDQVLTRYKFSTTMYFGKPMLYFIQYNEGKRPQFAYLRENQDEAVLTTPKDATHVLISLQYRAKSLKQGGSTKDWAENQGAVGFYKMDTSLPAQKGRKVFADIFIFELGGRHDGWKQLRNETMYLLCQTSKNERKFVEAFFRERERNKALFHGLVGRIAAKGVKAEYYENSMDLVFERGKAGCGQEVCYNFRYTGVFYGVLMKLLNDITLWGKLESNQEAWIERRPSGKLMFSEINTWIPWWYAEDDL